MAETIQRPLNLNIYVKVGFFFNQTKIKIVIFQLNQL